MAKDKAGLEVEVGITLNKLLRQLAQAEARMAKTAKKAEEGFTRSNKKIAKSFNGVNRSVGRLTGGNGLRMVALQLSQVGQQGAVTGNYLQALSIQMPDLLLAFGTFGALVGAAGAVMTPFIMGLFDASKASEEAKKAMEGLNAAMSAFESATDRANTPLGELAEKYGPAYAERMREILAIQRELAALDVAKNLQQVIDLMGEAEFGDLKAFTGDEFELLGRFMGELNTKMELLNATADEFGESLAQAAERTGISRERIKELENLRWQYRDAVKIIENVAKAFGVTDQEAGKLLAKFVALKDATGASEQADAMRDLREEITRVVGNGEQMEEVARKFLKLLLESESAILRWAAVDIASNLGQAADEAGRLADNLLEALSRRNMLDAAAARWGGGRGKDPRIFMREGGKGGKFVYTPPKSGGAKAQQKPLFADVEKEIEQLRRRQQLIGATQAQVARLTAKWNLLAEAKKRGLDLDALQIKTGMTLREEIEAQADTIGRLTEAYARAEEQASFYDQQQRALKEGMLDAIIEGENLAGVLENLAKAFARAALEAALFGTGPFAPQSGMGLLSGLFGSLFGGVQMAASGGLIGAGRPVIVGEEGPEMIVPSGTGKVLTAPQTMAALSGGGGASRGSDVVVNVINNSSGSARTERRRGPDGREIIDVIVEEGFVRGRYDGAQRSRFGTTVQRVKR